MRKTRDVPYEERENIYYKSLMEKKEKREEIAKEHGITYKQLSTICNYVRNKQKKED